MYMYSDIGSVRKGKTHWNEFKKKIKIKKILRTE